MAEAAQEKIRKAEEEAAAHQARIAKEQAEAKAKAEEEARITAERHADQRAKFGNNPLGKWALDDGKLGKAAAAGVELQFKNAAEAALEMAQLCPLPVGGVIGRGARIAGGVTGKLPRYQGPKPTYDVNPAHVPGPTLQPGKTPLPKDAEAAFKRAVPDDPVSPRHWYGKGDDGTIYRFSSSNDGKAHFSGADGVGDGIRNITEYARGRLEGN